MYLYRNNAKIDKNSAKTAAAAAAYTATYIEILCITIKYIEMHNNDLIASTYSIAAAAAAAAATPLQLHIK